MYTEKQQSVSLAGNYIAAIVDSINPDYGKKTYESIPIPEKLNEMVAQTIASQNKEYIRMSYENTIMTFRLVKIFCTLLRRF